MEKTKAFYLVSVLAVSALLLSSANALAVSEEAQRHFDRGMAAVEMAKSPDDYAPAIIEFSNAKIGAVSCNLKKLRRAQLLPAGEIA